ncbi:unnamed protein product [Prunus brigantina]
MQVDSKPFPSPVINMVNAQPRAEYREERRPAKGKESLVEPEPVLCSRCKYKRKAAEPSPPTVKRFDGQYDRRPVQPSASTWPCVRSIKGTKPQYLSGPQKRDDRWYHAQPGGNVQPLTRTQLRRMQRQAPQAREQIPQAEGSKHQRKMATADEPSSVPIVPAAKVASIKPPRTWRPRKDGDLREKGAVSAEPKATALGKTDEGIIDIYRGRDPPFSANGLSFLREFHKHPSLFANEEASQNKRGPHP